MREVLISGLVWEKIANLESYLITELKLSETAVLRRSARMRKFVFTIRVPVDYPLCRFKRWCMLGYHCAVFEKDWVFAYEIFNGGIIIRDMSHTSLLVE